VTLAVLLSLVLSISGCSTRIPLSKEDPSQWPSHSKIYIVLSDGRRYEVTDPALSDSKLMGRFDPDDRTEVAVDEIESLSIRKLDKTKTYGLVAWALVAAGILIGIMIDEDKAEDCYT
jgi:hypothetical protein